MLRHHPPIFFALQHKCGNTYFTKVLNEFEQLSSHPSFKFMIVRQAEFNPELTELHGVNTITRLRNFSMEQINKLPADSKILACRRDPRSLIVSCTDYHLRGSEAWTRQPNPKFGGKSYYDILNEASTDEERLIISMENVAGDILRRMESIAKDDKLFYFRLEDLTFDESCQVYHDICRFLQLSADNYELLFNIMKKNALWHIRKNMGVMPKHCTSGVSRDSIGRIKNTALQRYLDLFGELHVKLGYID